MLGLHVPGLYTLELDTLGFLYAKLLRTAVGGARLGVPDDVLGPGDSDTRNVW